MKRYSYIASVLVLFLSLFLSCDYEDKGNFLFDTSVERIIEISNNTSHSITVYYIDLVKHPASQQEYTSKATIICTYQCSYANESDSYDLIQHASVFQAREKKSISLKTRIARECALTINHEDTYREIILNSLESVSDHPVLEVTDDIFLQQ